MPDHIYVDFEYRRGGTQLILACLWNTTTGERIAIDCRQSGASEQLHELQTRWCDAIWFSFAADAEIGCFLQAGLDPSAMSWICLFTEAKQITGTHKHYLLHRPNLINVLHAFGLPASTTQHKVEMRNLILETDQYTDAQWLSIIEYCWSDLEQLPDLWDAIQQVHAEAESPYPVELAIFRADYLIAATQLSHHSRGFPIDTAALAKVFDNHKIVRHFVMQECNSYYNQPIYRYAAKTDTYHFNHRALEEYVADLPFDVDWERTPSGKLKLQEQYLKEFAKRNEHFEKLSETKKLLDQLKRADWRELVQPDGFLKGESRPYHTVTGRNQPMVSRGFILNCAPWLRHLVRAQPNHVLIAADWSQQEIVLAAALSGDEQLIAALQTGDVYMAMAIMSGQAPPGATKHTHGVARAACKSIQLGVGYGMGVDKLGKKIFLDLREAGADVTYEDCADRAARILAWHKETFRDYWSYVRQQVKLAKLRGWAQTFDGWTYFVDDRTGFTKLQNFPMQANAAVILREAVKRLAAERSDRVQFTCSLHDALYVYCHEDDATIAENLLRRCMDDATKSVMQFAKHPLPITVEFKTFTHETGYTDARGTKTYQQIMQIIDQQNTQMAA